MIAIIAAVAQNGVIGKDGKIPWYLPADLKRFRQLTTGHVLLMGRKTFESIGRALPGRATIVLSRQDRHDRGGRHVVDSTTSWRCAQSIEAAFQFDRGNRHLFVCGGGEVYRQVLDLGVVDKLYLTRVHADFDGDAYFPEVDLARWELVREESFDPTSEFPHSWSFLDYRRRA